MAELSEEEKGFQSGEYEYDEFGYTRTQPSDFRVGIPDQLRPSAWIVVLTELCERFTYYGASVMFTTYMRTKLNVAKAKSVSINRGFTFLAYATTLLGGYLSDQYLGKYKTITIFGIWYFIGTILLTISALPSFAVGTRLALFIVSTYLFIAFGTGGIKANVSTFVAEQVRIGYKPTKDPGVYYDSRSTTERCYRYFYWAINVGAFVGMLVCPTVADDEGYQYSFLIPACLMALCLIVFIPSYKFYINKKPSGSIFGKVIRTMKYAKHHKSSSNAHWLDAAKGLKNAEWDDYFVDGLKRSIKACKVFLFYPFYWALYNNMSDNFINQGMQMRRPKWLQSSQLNVINSLALVVFIPVFDSLVFPTLARHNIYLGPIKRITIGFAIVVVFFIYVTVLQKLVYNSPPFYDFTGPDVTAESFNDISVWLQVPAYLGVGISEIFASVTGLEYAFSQAPTELKSMLQALFLFTNAGGSLIGLILSIWSYDPAVLYQFAAQTVLLAIVAVIFWFCFRHYDAEVRAQQTYE
ncbi:hypothetical protein BB560_003244 [Smittium megazygosporum]|uniref:Major facilitator superfamily (MFS) profile domain-containing protein n=1 Tax=Smittium megazygosporum TaxID=133381 RepID=A0A2T9ZCJ3_9FUNG|nr:hypothetical protein BB560_003244 [Smittium megazygosporum]